jgi:hypothetical protein
LQAYHSASAAAWTTEQILDWLTANSLDFAIASFQEQKITDETAKLQHIEVSFLALDRCHTHRFLGVLELRLCVCVLMFLDCFALIVNFNFGCFSPPSKLRVIIRRVLRTYLCRLCGRVLQVRLASE